MTWVRLGRTGGLKFPLAHGHGRQDAIDEVGSELAHAPPAARRTETAATTAEGHHGRVPAALTLHAQQTVFEPATLEVRLELAPHERRPAACPVLRGRAREERREVRRDRPVEHGLLGLAALIGRPGTRDRRAVQAGPERVVSEVVRQYRVTREAIFGGKRGQENEARKVAMYLVKRCCDRTLPEMAKDFGVGSNSTVSWSCRGIEARMVKEKKLKDRIEKIVASINQLHT